MARLIGNRWRGSAGLLIPYRQWIRERLPNGNEGFACCGDDGFFRGFDPRNSRDIGWVVPTEFKTFGARIDPATDRTLAALNTGRIRGTLAIRLHDGNVPGELHHYPVAREVASGDWLPEQPVVASRITVTDNYTRHDELVTEQQLVALIKRAVGWVDPARRCPGSGSFAGYHIDKSSSVWRAECPECGDSVPLFHPMDGGPDAQLDDHEVR